MADYTIISDVSQHMVRILRERMCPEQISSPDMIAEFSPADQDVDHILGLYLYDIREEDGTISPAMMNVGGSRLMQPPKPYSLYYMLFINNSSQLDVKAGDAEKILGRVAQIINDVNTVRPTQLQNWLEMDEPPIVFTSSRLPMDEKVRIWKAIRKPYQVALFYTASPVFISSEIVVNAPRVTEAKFSLELQSGRGDR